MARRRYSVIILAMASLAHAGVAPAFEEVSPHPGTRAMGMAGVFGPQADDCSAIWYNPGGPVQANMIKRDSTLEYGAIPFSNSAREYETANALKFACGYWSTNDRRIGIGISYATLYQLGFDVTDFVQPLSLQTFGATDVTYRQASLALSTPLSKQLAIGGSLDFVWTDVDCSDVTCVDFGPMAPGAAFGATLEVARTPSRHVTVSGLWRTRAALRYYDTPSSGIGTVLEHYIPDRPNTLGIGVHAQFSMPAAAVNTNASLERIAWSAASAVRAPSPDFNKLGVSGEIIVPLSDALSVAVRAGASHARATQGDDTASIYALGTGISWGNGHGMDIAFERRIHKDATIDEIDHVAISYSLQR